MGKDIAKKGEISLYEIGCSRGRPAKYKNNKEIEEIFTEYLIWCFDNELPLTITGTALFMGFSSRQSLYDYGKKKEYSYTIKRIHLAIENSYETQLTISRNPGGSIFALKNFEWTDVHTIDDRRDKIIPQITLILTHLTTEKRDEIPGK